MCEPRSDEIGRQRAAERQHHHDDGPRDELPGAVTTTVRDGPRRPAATPRMDLPLELKRHLVRSLPRLRRLFAAGTLLCSLLPFLFSPLDDPRAHPALDEPGADRLPRPAARFLDARRLFHPAPREESRRGSPAALLEGLVRLRRSIPPGGIRAVSCAYPRTGAALDWASVTLVTQMSGDKFPKLVQLRERWCVCGRPTWRRPGVASTDDEVLAKAAACTAEEAMVEAASTVDEVVAEGASTAEEVVAKAAHVHGEQGRGRGCVHGGQGRGRGCVHGRRGRGRGCARPRRTRT